MADELVFTVEGSKATPALGVTLEEAGFKERQHLQEWVIAHPDIIGDGIKVVAFEFDYWQSAGGKQESDRLDVLGLDRDGYLVVAELKRGRAPETTDMQAIKYAAMVSGFDLDTLAEHHARFLLNRTGQAVTDEEALAQPHDWAPTLSDETLLVPRIVLLAADFPPSVTSTAVYLTRGKLDVSLVRFEAYRTPGDEIVVTVSRIFPVAEIETITPRSPQERATQDRKREASAVSRIISAHVVEAGTELHFVTNEVSAAARNAVEAWIVNNPERGTATWQENSAGPLLWMGDMQPYTPTGLARKIIADATGQAAPPLQGPRFFANEEGRTLREIADDLTVSWDWASYRDVLGLSDQRIEVGAALVERIEDYIGEHELSLTTVFNKGRVVFQRSGGYNVVVVDLLYTKPPRFAVKIPERPDELGLDDPYPQLHATWKGDAKAWGWTVSTLLDVPDVGKAIELALPYQPATGPMTNPTSNSD